MNLNDPRVKIIHKKACYYNNNALYDCSDKVLAEKLQRYYAAYGIDGFNRRG